MTRGGQSAAFTYDGAGNLATVTGTLLPSWTLTHNDAGELTQIAHDGVTDSYVYDFFGRRMRETLPGWECWAHAYAGNRLLEDACLTGGTTPRNRYTPESGSFYTPLLSERSCCLLDVRYPLYDGTGTVHGLVAADGTLADTYRFDSFGRPLSGNTSTLQPARYGGAWGYQTDSRTTNSTGLAQLGARWYWPEVGRFLEQDPAGAGDNWYAYAGNNPVTGIDPAGLMFRDPFYGFGCHADARGVDPAPVDAGGNPLPPPVPVPGHPELPWGWNPDPGNDRGGTWNPRGWNGARDGSPPNANWDPKPPGHWDVNDGQRKRRRYGRDGTPLTPDQAHGRAPWPGTSTPMTPWVGQESCPWAANPARGSGLGVGVGVGLGAVGLGGLLYEGLVGAGEFLGEVAPLL